MPKLLGARLSETYLIVYVHYVQSMWWVCKLSQATSSAFLMNPEGGIMRVWRLRRLCIAVFRNGNFWQKKSGNHFKVAVLGNTANPICAHDSVSVKKKSLGFFYGWGFNVRTILKIYLFWTLEPNKRCSLKHAWIYTLRICFEGKTHFRCEGRKPPKKNKWCELWRKSKEPWKIICLHEGRSGGKRGKNMINKSVMWSKALNVFEVKLGPVRNDCSSPYLSCPSPLEFSNWNACWGWGAGERFTLIHRKQRVQKIQKLEKLCFGIFFPASRKHFLRFVTMIRSKNLLQAWENVL